MKKFLRNIFSVSNKDVHKVVIIFGIKLKFKSKKLILKKQYSDLNNKYNDLDKEYKSFKQAQIIDKQNADKQRGKVYKRKIIMEADSPRVYSINWIKDNSKVLDVGCACGEFWEKFILKDKHSHVVQYVVKCKKSTANNLSEINSEKIQTELEKI